MFAGSELRKKGGMTHVGPLFIPKLLTIFNLNKQITVQKYNIIYI